MSGLHKAASGVAISYNIDDRSHFRAVIIEDSSVY